MRSKFKREQSSREYVFRHFCEGRWWMADVELLDQQSIAISCPRCGYEEVQEAGRLAPCLRHLRATSATRAKLKELRRRYGSLSAVIAVAVDNLYRDEAAIAKDEAAREALLAELYG